MNAIYSLLIISIVSGFLTSMLAYFIHKSRWHVSRKKSPFKLINLFISNIYQFNGIFLNVVSISVAIATSVIAGNIMFIIFYCDSLVFDIGASFIVFVSVTLFRIVLLLITYSLFYEEEMLKN
jgi:uncharacterized membrane-anchored protein